MAKMAGEIKVGEVVEFEVGSPVTVTAIEENWTVEEPDPAAYLIATYGKSLYFDAVFGDPGDPMVCQTAYVRREKSPISGDRIVR